MSSILEKLANKFFAKQFHTERNMFYVSSDCCVVFPNEECKILSHREWFAKMNIDYNTTIRGYYTDSVLMLYVGEQFEIPYLTQTQMFEIICQIPTVVQRVGLGAKTNWFRTLLGLPWKPKQVRFYSSTNK